MATVIDINVAYQMCLLVVALVLDIEGLPVPQIITEKIGHFWPPDKLDKPKNINKRATKVILCYSRRKTETSSSVILISRL